MTELGVICRKMGRAAGDVASLVEFDRLSTAIRFFMSAELTTNSIAWLESETASFDYMCLTVPIMGIIRVPATSPLMWGRS